MLNVVVTGTGPLFTLEEAKAHLRVTTEDEDELIGAMADAAVQHCLLYCGVGLVPQGYEPTFKAAAMMMLAHFFTRRAAVVVGTIASEMPLGVSALLNPHRLLRI